MAVLECGGGWIAHWMDRLDEFLESYGWATAPLSLTPREYFQRQCWISFDPGERTAQRARRRSSAPTGSCGRPTSRTATRSTPAWSTSCASTTTGMDPTPRAGAVRRQRARDVRHRRSPVVSRRSISSSAAAPSSTAPARRRAPPTSRSRDGRDRRRSVAIDDAAAPRSSTPTACSVTPGFVDVHTHYDAQLHWDPTASPASWHGVTTLFTGNCGFTLAPAEPDDVEWLLLMLSRVEGMSADALAAGRRLRAAGRFGDFLDGLDGRLGVNVGANVGHCAVRRFVMGDDASERAATADEIGADAGARPRRARRRRDRVHVVPARAARRARRPGRAVEPRRARRAGRARRRCWPSSAAARSSSSPARSSPATTTTIARSSCAMAARVGPARAPQHAHAACPTRPTAGRAASSSREAAADDGLDGAPDVRGQPAGRALLARHHVPVRRDAELPRHAHAARRPDATRTPARPRGARPDARRDRRPARPLVRVRVAGAARRDGSPRPSNERSLDQSVTEIARRARTPTRSTRSSTSRSPKTSRPSSCSPRRRSPERRAATERMIQSPVDDGRAAPTAARTSSRSAAPTTRRACSPSGSRRR